jgi:hypothetical protein
MLENVMYKLIFERFPVSLTEMDNMYYSDFQTMIEKLSEYSVELKNKMNKDVVI